jgi:diacylglycerol kinase (ATP)
VTRAGRAAFAFFVHPQAGRGGAARRLACLLREARPSGMLPIVLPVRSTAEASAALRGLAPETVPVAAGGDGMAALLATALRECGRRETAMGLLPLGTGNILARELGLSSARAALDALEHGVVRRIDVMRTSHATAPLALVSISGGFEGRFMAGYARHRRRTRLLAALAALPAAVRRRSGLALDLDGQTVLRSEDAVFSAGLYNAPSYAGGLRMSPEADMADGYGGCVVYTTAGAYVSAVGAALGGGAARPHPGVCRRRWQSARLESAWPLQIDGESLGAGALSVWMEPQALAIIAAGPPKA